MRGFESVCHGIEMAVKAFKAVKACSTESESPPLVGAFVVYPIYHHVKQEPRVPQHAKHTVLQVPSSAPSLAVCC